MKRMTGIVVMALLASVAQADDLTWTGAESATWNATALNWQDAGEALPAFLAVAAMPFTYSISDGLMLGVIAYTAINALSGQFKRIHWIMYILTALFIAKYALM